jgi:mannose-6-phosphate isomerase-like protein (cupin superfamily)
VASLLASILFLAAQPPSRTPLAERIARVAPESYRSATGVHLGAGEMLFGTLIPNAQFTTNLLFVHRGVLQPGGGIGHHVHSHMEEMYFILDGEAEFTVNGRTSTIQGPAAVPCRMGDAHAILNTTDRPVQWMNVAVSTRKGKYDVFNLGDDRVGARQDEIPVFISTRFDRALLREQEGRHGGGGAVLYRRAFAPEVFYTNWSFVDHLVVPAGASVGAKRHPSVEEIYYVLTGEGVVTIGDESAPIGKDEALVVSPDDVHSIANAGSDDLEIVVIGAATEKWMLDTIEVEPGARR